MTKREEPDFSGYGEPHDLWDDPREGLDPEEFPWWTWDHDPVDVTKNGPTDHPPNRKGRWYRWYFVYHAPTCEMIKISADEDPGGGGWFNPHPSSGDI